ncbi:MAG: TadE family protein [Chloroflexota bacterium]
MVEMALVAPLFFMVLFGIVILGIGVFYQQQVTNAAREAARYAAIHSATAQCPTASTLDPRAGAAGAYVQQEYVACDRPADGWPKMAAAGRARLFGIDRSQVLVSACWSGYRDVATATYDAPPPGTYQISGSPVTFTTAPAQCRIDGADPTNDSSAIGCRAGMPTVDEASNMSEKEGVMVANRVTAYACYVWRPPLAGFLLIPPAVTLRAAITEPIERQR